MAAEAALERQAREVHARVGTQPRQGQLETHLRAVGPDGPALDASEGPGQVVHRAPEAPGDLGHPYVRRGVRAHEETGLAHEFVAGAAPGCHDGRRLARSPVVSARIVINDVNW